MLLIMPPDRFRQVLISKSRYGTAWVVRLETLKKRQKGPRRSGLITGEGAAVCGGLNAYDDAGHSIICDWLEDNADQVVGLAPADVRGAVAAVRANGGWFATPPKRKSGAP